MYYIGVIISAVIVLILYVFDMLCKLFDSKTFKSGGSDRNVQMLSKQNIQTSEEFLAKAPYLLDLIYHADTCLLMDDIPHSLEYTPSGSFIKTTMHVGQLKLLLTEVEFLTDNLEKDEPAIVIYAGSAPSNKIHNLAEMFKHVKFVLVDPNEHYVMYPDYKDMYDHMNEFMFFKAAKSKMYKRKLINTPSGKVYRENFDGNMENICELITNGSEKFYIIEDYYTDELSEILKTLTDKTKVLFISDIRSRFESEDNPTDLDIIWNSALMYNWLQILKPAKFMLKFRTPYEVGAKAYEKVKAEYKDRQYTHNAIEKCKINFIENVKSNKFTYIKPELIYMQAFAGHSSTESRLVASSLDLYDFDCDEYNNKYFYYNRLHRPFGYHESHEKYLDPKLGIDRCGDCAIMCTIYENYYKKFTNVTDLRTAVRNNIKSLLRTIRRSLRFSDTVHGIYFNKYRGVEHLIHQQNGYMLLAESRALLDIRQAKSKKLTINDAYNFIRFYEFLKEEYPKPNDIIPYIHIGFYYGFLSGPFLNILKLDCDKYKVDCEKLITGINNIMLSNNDLSEVIDSDDALSLNDVRIQKECIYPKDDINEMFIENALLINIPKTKHTHIDDEEFRQFVFKCNKMSMKNIYLVCFSPIFGFTGIEFEKIITFSSGSLTDIKQLKNKLVIVRLTGLNFQLKKTITNEIIKENLTYINVSDNTGAGAVDTFNTTKYKVYLTSHNRCGEVKDVDYIIRTDNIPNPPYDIFTRIV